MNRAALDLVCQPVFAVDAPRPISGKTVFHAVFGISPNVHSLAAYSESRILPSSPGMFSAPWRPMWMDGFSAP